MHTDELDRSLLRPAHAQPFADRFGVCRPSMSHTRTATIEGLPWDESGQRASTRTVLAIVWSLDEPGRVGEVAVLPTKGTVVLGRGDDQHSHPRLRFGRLRPDGFQPGAPLTGARLSRQQLHIRGGTPGRATNVGRSELLLDGTPCAEAKLEPGATLEIRNQLILRVVSRDLTLRECAHTHALGVPDANGIVGESEAVWELRRQIRFAANQRRHTLIVGESGTGKELVARAIHQASSRAAGPWVSRNAATLPESLVDAELFGNVADYPNAGMPERKGLVGEAHQGTLFLDEITQLPDAAQASLLRVMDGDGEYQRLGASGTSHTDVRVIGATNKSETALAHDLAARLPLRIHLPNLSERAEDIPLLIHHLLSTVVASEDTTARFRDDRGNFRISPKLVRALMAHTWSTHVRELEQVLWAALASSRGNYLDLTEETRARLNSEEPSPSTAAQQPDVAMVREALDAAKGNVTAAARNLGLSSRYALYRLMRKYGLESSKTEP